MYLAAMDSPNDSGSGVPSQFDSPRGVTASPMPQFEENAPIDWDAIFPSSPQTPQEIIFTAPSSPAVTPGIGLKDALLLASVTAGIVVMLFKRK